MNRDGGPPAGGRARGWVRGAPWISLLFVPLVLAVAGGAWTVERAFEPGRGTFVDGARRSEVALAFRAEGAPVDDAVQLPASATLELALPPLDGEWNLVLQAAPSPELEVSAAPDDATLWRVPEIPNQEGLRTRSTLVDPGPGEHTLRIRAIGTTGSAIAGLRIERRPWIVRRWIAIPLLWGAWLLSRRRLARAWVGADAAVAALVLFHAFFRWRPATLALTVLAGMVLALWLLRRWSDRSPLGAPALALCAVLVCGVLLPAVVRGAVAASLARRHELTVDHRMRPDGEEINGDGIRFRGSSAELRDEDFVVLFLGDSFTYGLYLDYAQTYPYAFEALAARLDCEATVRAVNVGWISSSPLLALRWLREHGAEYRPDLVVYALDVTDFYDDLAYEQQLRRGNDLHVDPARVLAYWVKRYTPFAADAPLAERWAGFVREPPDLGDFRPEMQPPRDRFFVTAQPLEASRARIEAGVGKNLAAIERFSAERLGAPLALVLYPRAYQYSARESPDNWEAPWYRVLGPYVREPFRYFAEARERLPYAVLDLLPDFRDSAEFPLFRRDDPHWTPAGAELAARATSRRLAAARLLPCREGKTRGPAE